MVLEATMLVVDNSEYMRNGDYQPSRFEAQSDAVSVIFGTKTQSNPENTVGVMTMAAKGPEVLVTPTTDLGKILTALHNARITGESDLSTGIQVAQLALKHRQNKNQRQRIIVFVGSPLNTDEKSLVKLAKKLKKNNVAVDIISFGENEENQARLQTFIDNVQSGDNSHLVTVPAGPYLLSDKIVNSAILAGEFGMPGGMADDDGAGAGGGGGGGQNFEFGIDPSLDPELAMALRMSLEEERARQTASTSAAPAAAGASSTSLAPVPEVPMPAAATAAPSTTTATSLIPGDGEDDEDALLQQAIAMSQQPTSEDVEMHVERGDEDDEDMSEEEAIARAIEMSMKPESEEEKK